LFAEQEMIKLAVVRAREDSEKALADAEARLQVMFTATAIGIGIGDLHGKVTNANPAMTTMLGYALHELRQHYVQDLLYHEDRTKVFPKLLELRNGMMDRFDTLARFVHRDGEPVWTYVSFSLVRDEAGRPQYPVATVENRSYTHLLQDELQRQSVHDSLTGLANAKKFESQLETVLANTAAEHRVALSFWDLDGFKVINDGLSKKASDGMLQIVSRKLRATFEPHGGLVARVAGDGFAVLLKRSPGRSEMGDIVQEAMDDLAEPQYTLTDNANDGVAVYASVGVVEEAAGNTTSLELIRRAEITLHRAKAKGKAQWILADTEQDAIDQEHFHLGALIPGALENGDFTVYYQPALLLDGRTLASMHAIPFWEHAELGRLHPRQFIDLAKETGFVVPLGRWLLDRVGQQAGEWREQFGDAAPVLCVRLPARIVHDHHVVHNVNRILREYSLDPDRLQINVPAAVVREDDDAVETLRALSDNGVRLGVSGVGAGGINLLTLRDLGLRDVMMNGALVDSLVAGDSLVDSTDDTARTFANGVAGMVGIAHLIGCTVTAGNLDNAERVDRMRKLGIDIGFGAALEPVATQVDVQALLSREDAR
ncbi:MAG: EAL domain-containing protein, partial [Sciscionella sp.]